MPEMDGMEMCRELRKYEADGVLNFKNTTIFTLTALEEEQLGDIKAAGFDYYLRKPIQWDYLKSFLVK